MQVQKYTFYCRTSRSSDGCYSGPGGSYEKAAAAQAGYAGAQHMLIIYL